jgi:putative transposase
MQYSTGMHCVCYHRYHVHMFVSVPPKIAISDLVRLIKGRSSHKIKRKFPRIKKHCWGCRFFGPRVFFNH